MIKGFYDKETEKIWRKQFSKRLPHDIHRSALIKLRMINRAEDINDLRIPPGNQLEGLKGDRVEQSSIRINAQWRICFVWDNGNAYRVEICDYH